MAVADTEDPWKTWQPPSWASDCPLARRDNHTDLAPAHNTTANTSPPFHAIILDAQHDDIHSEHEFLRALIHEQKPRPMGRSTISCVVNALDSDGRVGAEAGLGISLPRSVVVRGGRGIRSVSMPVETLRSMAMASMESIHEASLPSSPPELSYSKSSKSSSSINSDDELSDAASTSKSGHFEEVVLEDGERDSGDDCNQPPASRPTLRRPPARSPNTSDLRTMPRRRSGTSPQTRALPNGMRQKYPGLHVAVTHATTTTHAALRDQSLNLPNGRSMHRAVTSPSSPFTRQRPSQHMSSRSPSPNKLPYITSHAAVSPHSLASATPKASPESPKENSSHGTSKRSAWQPSRKSVQELEAEYNDEDEDVPDDAILENVPISPMPGQYATLKSPSTTTFRSPTPSPNRRPSPSYANLHSANIPKQAKRSSARSMYSSPRSPRSPRNGRPPMMPHSATISAFPAEPFLRKHRSKSWTEDLNEEAKQLSQALEEYAGKLSIEKRHSASNTPSSSPPPPSMAKARAKTSAYEVPSATTILPSVPPLQKGNIMIDPLPISKEKEAVLTRTRPSWLPPKCQKEEAKHLKEFQQMMARAAEAEKKRLMREQDNKETRIETQSSIARIWDQHVIPNWDAVVKEPRTRELWWRGVTPRSRGEVWQKAIGNELELSAASFEAALARAHDLEETIGDMPAEQRANSKEAAWFDAIVRDVPNVYPELHMYQHGEALHQSLTNVLKAYAMYRSDVGYVYGTHLVAGIVCLLLQPADAFVFLANMLNRPLPLAFLVHDKNAMARAYDLTLSTLKYKYTKLHDHLTDPSVGLKPEEFLDPIFRCLFAYNMSHEHVSRIWDVFVFEGDRALIRAAVAVLGKLESKLYGSREEVLRNIGWCNEGRWELGSEDEFITAVREAGKVDGKPEQPGSA